MQAELQQLREHAQAIRLGKFIPAALHAGFLSKTCLKHIISDSPISHEDDLSCFCRDLWDWETWRWGPGEEKEAVQTNMQEVADSQAW